ncbi:MAG: lysine--tRNA ligase, partial [Humibacter sp.]
MATEQPAAELSADDLAADEIGEQKAVRLAKRERLLAEADAAGGAYPVGVPITATIPELRGKYGELEADASTGEFVGIAGRVVHLRNTGKLC